MTVQLEYPETQYHPTPLVDLSVKEERERLSKPALRAFFNIMERWSIRDEDARKLLGGVASSTFYEYKRDPNRVLGQDRLTRVSFLVGVFKDLNILHGEELADRWVSMANQNKLFRGKTPLEYMIRGGSHAMQIVRQLLDARRGGL